jgi:hypothetical protein
MKKLCREKNLCGESQEGKHISASSRNEGPKDVVNEVHSDIVKPAIHIDALTLMYEISGDSHCIITQKRDESWSLNGKAEGKRGGKSSSLRMWLYLPHVLVPS